MKKQKIPNEKQSSFADRLQKEFLLRQRKNSRYSLRAFARFLRTDVSQLSKMMRGTRKISKVMIQKFGKLLNLEQQEITEYQIFANMIQKFPSKPLHEMQYTDINDNALECISDLRHFLIFELMKTKKFRPDVEWIAQATGYSQEDVKTILGRLVRSGLINKTKNGVWTHNNGWSVSYWPGEKATSAAHRKGQADILKLATEALHKVPVEKRDQSGMMMATNAEKLRQAKKLIRQFRLELCAFLEDTDEKDAVYQLSISLFPLLEISDQGLPSEIKKEPFT